MNKNPSLPLKLLACALFAPLTGCQSIDKVARSDPPAPPPSLSADRRENVWLPDQVTPYIVGRYTSPSDPDLVHEGHLLYRRERTSRPNLTPPEVVVFPPIAAPTTSNAAGVLRDALTSDFNQQRTTTLAIIDQAQQLQREARQFNSKMEELRDALARFTRLDAELQSMSNRLEGIETQLQTPPHNAPPKR